MDKPCSTRRGLPTPLLVAFALTFLTAAAAACSSGGGGHTPPPVGYRGEFRLERYMTYLPGSPVAPFLFAQASFQAPDNHYLGAGPTMKFKSAANTVPLVRLDVLGKILYQHDPAIPLDLALYSPDTGYDVTSPGANENQGIASLDLTNSIRTPSPFTLITPDTANPIVVSSGGSDIPLAWNTGDGDYVLVILAVAGTAGGQSLGFKVADDGSFSIPANQIATLPIGSGTLTVERMIEGSGGLPGGGTLTTFGGDAVTIRLIRT